MVAKHVTGWWAYAHVNGGVEKSVLRKTPPSPTHGTDLPHLTNNQGELSANRD